MTNKIAILNVETNDLEIREMNEKEQKDFVKFQKESEIHVQELQNKESAKQSAFEKLKALGLSPEEIAAITGA